VRCGDPFALLLQLRLMLLLVCLKGCKLPWYALPCEEAQGLSLQGQLGIAAMSDAEPVHNPTWSKVNVLGASPAPLGLRTCM
jgi:hypothetical protein